MKIVSYWYVYMIRCNDNSLYTGISTDPVRRLKEHQKSSKKAAKYLRSRTAIKLEYIEQLQSHSDALKREYQIKQLLKVKKEALICSELNQIECFDLT